MVTPIKVDSMSFSYDAVALRKQLAEIYQSRTIAWIKEKKITSEFRIKSTTDIFIKKAEEDYARRLKQAFPHPAYEPLIDLACLGSMNFFDTLREQIKAAIEAQKK